MFVHEIRCGVSRSYFTEGRRRSPFRPLDELVIIRRPLLENHL
jgi:hypothetical protein